MVRRVNGLLAGMVLLWAPLALFTKAADGFTLPKEIIGSAALAFLLVQALLGGGLWRSWLTRLAILFFAWMLLDSLAVSLLKTEALKGSVHLFLLTGSLAAFVWLCSRGYPYEKLVHFALASGGLMALYGLAQAAGLDRSIQWNNRFDARVFSTLGNPNYLGGHLAALLPVAFVLGLRSSGTKERWSWLGLTGLMFAGLMVTRVRGAELAFAGSFGLMGIFFLLPWGKELAKRNLKLLSVFLFALLLGGGFFVQRHGGLSSFGMSEVSVQQRLETYKVTWEIIKDKTLFGIGLGNLGAQYPAYQHRPYQPSDYSQHPYTYTEHVHNEYLQFWTEGGIAGLFLFLSMLAAFALAAMRLFKNQDIPANDKELLIGIVGGVAAVLIQSVSNFPLRIAPTALVFGLWLAAPLALGAKAVFQPEAKSGISFRTRLPWMAMAFVFLVGLKALAGSVAYRDTAGETSLGNHSNALYFGGRLTVLSPKDPKAWLTYGKSLEAAGKYEEAVSVYGKSVELNPNYVEGLVAMADLQMRGGRFLEAVDNCGKTELIAPNYSMPPWIRAAGFYQLKRYEEAVQEYQKFLACSPDNAQAYSNMGVCYIQLKRKADAVVAWKKALALNPNNPQVVQYLKAQNVRP